MNEKTNAARMWVLEPILLERSRGAIMLFAETWKREQSPGHNPISREPHLTCDPAAKELQPEGDARVPGLRADPDEPRQQWGVQLVQNHLCRIIVGLEYL